jgi:spore coat protein CotH
MLSDHIWTEYIWKVEKGSYDPAALATGLPVIRIDTDGGQTVKSRENYIDATISISGSDNPAHDREETKTEIRGRGNTTWWYPKKPYRIKLDKKKDGNFFGYEAAKSWVLLANHQDPTLIMNTVTFELGNRMGFPYTNHAVHVELVLNGVYEGSYVLTEQVQVGKGRVDIDEDDGFLVELDSYYDEEPKFTSSASRLPVMIKSPEDLDDPSGYDFVKNSINELDNFLFAANFPDNGYRDLIDMDTFVKFLIINEVVGNSEISWPKSAYMYRDKNGKICMGPLWDFDGAFSYSGNSENVYFKNSDYRISMHPFFKRFFDDPAFVTRYKEIWNENYNEIRGMGDFIAEKGIELEKSAGANFTVWQWLNKLDYSTEISKMKSWWNARVTYLNTEINK